MRISDIISISPPLFLNKPDLSLAAECSYFPDFKFPCRLLSLPLHGIYTTGISNPNKVLSEWNQLT